MMDPSSRLIEIDEGDYVFYDDVSDSLDVIPEDYLEEHCNEGDHVY